jgi:hypothetical protein
MYHAWHCRNNWVFGIGVFSNCKVMTKRNSIIGGQAKQAFLQVITGILTMASGLDKQTNILHTSEESTFLDVNMTLRYKCVDL